MPQASRCPHQDADYISHIALDIGGSLIKLVYFSPDKPGAGLEHAEGGYPQPAAWRCAPLRTHGFGFLTKLAG